jgi:hypothetical protein
MAGHCALQKAESPSRPQFDPTDRGAMIMDDTNAARMLSTSADSSTAAGTTPQAAFRELTGAYQELMTKSGKTLTGALQALSAAKNPAEFMQLQQKIMKEGMDDAVRDGQHIAQLTAAAFTAAFQPLMQMQPMMKRFQTMTKTP